MESTRRRISYMCSSIWFLSTLGVFASITLFIHILYKRHALELWYTPENLQQIKVLGLLGLLAGLAGMATYLGIASSSHEGKMILIQYGLYDAQ